MAAWRHGEFLAQCRYAAIRLCRPASTLPAMSEQLASTEDTYAVWLFVRTAHAAAIALQQLIAPARESVGVEVGEALSHAARAAREERRPG
jgi:hypothetical protein